MIWEKNYTVLVVRNPDHFVQTKSPELLQKGFDHFPCVWGWFHVFGLYDDVCIGTYIAHGFGTAPFYRKFLEVSGNDDAFTGNDVTYNK